MVYMGYMRWDGIELINNDRLNAYVWNMGIPMYTCDEPCSTLDQAIRMRGWKTIEGDYNSPAADLAPWYNPYNPESQEFAGIALMEMTNIDASTLTVGVENNVNDGATITEQRREAREVEIRVLLLGSTERGVNFGHAWLNTILENGDVCNVAVGKPSDYRTCMRTRLDFALHCPDETGKDFRYLLDVYVSGAPQVLSRHAVGGIDCGNLGTGAWIELEFTMTALNPSIWHEPIDSSLNGAGLDYAQIAAEWDFYKGGDPIPANDDVYDSPNVYAYPHTYEGLWAALQRKVTDG